MSAQDQTDNNTNFNMEYNEIFESMKTGQIVKTEWVQEGDYFTKFSMYDSSYAPVPTLDSTTLIGL